MHRIGERVCLYTGSSLTKHGAPVGLRLLPGERGVATGAMLGRVVHVPVAVAEGLMKHLTDAINQWVVRWHTSSEACAAHVLSPARIAAHLSGFREILLGPTCLVCQPARPPTGSTTP